jgi:ketosteroid isomerase-like protein
VDDNQVFGLHRAVSNVSRRKGFRVSQQNIELVKNGYEAFNAGDAEAVMNLFDDDVEWIQPGNSAVSGTYRGKAELGEFLMRLGEKGMTATTRSFLADGDTVVAFTEVSIAGEVGQDADVFTVRDGKVVHAQVYADTAMLERVFGVKEVAAG